jgi:hypothetical protein
MAFATSGWDGFPASGSTLPKTALRRSLARTFVLGTGFMLCASAALLMYEFSDNGMPATRSRPAAPVVANTTPTVSLPSLEQNAERFLKSSLSLARVCADDCPPSLSTTIDTEILGHFAPPLPAETPFPTGAPYEKALVTLRAELVARSGAAKTAAARALVPAAPPPAAALPAPPLPSVAPVPRAVAEGVAPVPAARLTRPAPSESPVAVASLPADSIPMPPASRPAPAAPTTVIGRHDRIAVYDISAATVYLPDGEKLEAHSGLGPWVDNPRYAYKRNVGPTPPNVYNLVMRKGRFHGVEALRLLPADGENKYGRVGLLAHTYLLRGRPGESNGCVAFKNYSRFLAAFKRGAVKKMIVVPSLKSSGIKIAALGR